MTNPNDPAFPVPADAMQMTRTKLPTLTAKDICKGAYNGPNGTHCARGWVLQLYPRNRPVEDALRIAIGGRLITRWNDNPRTSKKRIAEVLNKVIRKLARKGIRPKEVQR